MDLEAEHKTLSVDEIIRLQRLKTGELFAVSCEAGAILGKAPGMMRNLLRAYAHDMGLAFQITDDLLDVEGTRTETGKGVRKDKIKGKATLVSGMGVERARHAQLLTKQAISHLDVFDKKADCLRELARFVVSANHEPDRAGFYRRRAFLIPHTVSLADGILCDEIFRRSRSCDYAAGCACSGAFRRYPGAHAEFCTWRCHGQIQPGAGASVWDEFAAPFRRYIATLLFHG